MVSKVPQTRTVKADTNLCPSVHIAQGFQPFLERRFSLGGFVIINFVWKCLYGYILAYKLQNSKDYQYKKAAQPVFFPVQRLL